MMMSNKLDYSIIRLVELIRLNSLKTVKKRTLAFQVVELIQIFLKMGIKSVELIRLLKFFDVKKEIHHTKGRNITVSGETSQRVGRCRTKGREVPHKG